MFEELEPELQRLIDLSIGELRSEETARAKLEALSCVEHSAQARSHVTTAVLQPQEGGSWGPWQGQNSWRMEWVAPDRYRVFQLADEDGDEWLFIGNDYYRCAGPWIVGSGGDPERKMSELLLADRYLDIARRFEPSSAGWLDDGTTSLLIAEYTELDDEAVERLLGAFAESEPQSLRTQLTLDVQKNLVVRTLVEWTTSEGGLEFIRAFAGYERELELEPPPVTSGEAWFSPTMEFVTSD